jgi:two-component system, OmpR family, sensor kinase
MMRRLRIRTRLVLGSAVLAAIVLATALVVARAEISQLLYDSAVTLAGNDLAPFAVDLQQNPDEQPDTVANGLLIVIRDPSGATIRDTAPHDVRLALPAKATGGAFTFGDDEGRSYVVVSRIVHNPQGDWSLWAARDVSSSESAVAGIDLVFIVIGVGLLLLLVLVSFFLVRGALRPVEELRRDAERLSEGELLPVADNDDELARLAATLNTSVTKVRESAARERRMVSDAAHELRTPLAALVAELELTRRHLDDPQAMADGLRSAQLSAQRLGDLATNLLELSRLDDGGQILEIEDGEAIAADLLTAIDRARTLAAGKDLDIDGDIDIRDADARYRVGPLAIARIVDNLLSNAARAVGDQGRIVLRAHDDTSCLVLRVEDDGPGAPEDFLPIAFDRFSRADTSRKLSGSGLGLALVAAIADAADGDARAENLHPGFAVEVRLPKM